MWGKVGRGLGQVRRGQARDCLVQEKLVASLQGLAARVPAMATTEHTINDALAAVLRTKRHLWRTKGVIQSEHTAALDGNDKRPDIVIAEPNLSPVVVETELAPAATVEQDAINRLGHRLRTTQRIIFSVIAVRLPKELRKLDGASLTAEIRRTNGIEFALFSGSTNSSYNRWPVQGWLRGGVDQLACIAESVAVPASVIENAAEQLIQGVSGAAGLLGEVVAKHPSVATKISKALCQSDNEQTRRMAMTIVANAFIFQENLAGGSGALSNIRSIDETRNSTSTNLLSKADILAEWHKILKINYWPIFDIARRIVEVLPSGQATDMLECLAQTAGRLLSQKLTRSHDLTGSIFQKLIVDRKFLAAFYTTPPSAALLMGLALSSKAMPTGDGWGDRDKIESLRIADFACGTGTLLSAAYHRIAQLHELSGGDAKKLHTKMMSQVLVGCDILPSATHLTASMLSSFYPSVRYEKSLVMTVPYGIQKDGTIALGSLDLLKAQATFDLLSIHAKAAGGTGELQTNTWSDLPHSCFDLVAMNPPFTRATGHEAGKVGVPVPMFAAFGKEDEEQRAMSKQLNRLTSGTCAHGNAGEASYFLPLADTKLKEGGRLALIMPASLLAGEAWDKSRKLLRESYQELVVMTIAGCSDMESSFSADTGMGECLLVATKRKRRLDHVDRNAPVRARFIVLRRRPETQLEAAELARSIVSEIASGSPRTIEDGPVGGDELHIGTEMLGTMIESPLPIEGPWSLSRISDFSIAQVAYELVSHSRLWLPSMPKENALSLAVSTVKNLAKIGPYHMDINGSEKSGGAVRGPFDIHPIAEKTVATYPVLWAHEAEHERSMVVTPDREGLIRKGNNNEENDLIRTRAKAIWESASSVHLNRDFRFNSQSIAVAWTNERCIGGRAWPSLLFENNSQARAFTIWGNCTIGLLLYWWISNKQQAGRGSVTITAVPDLHTLDVSILSEAQLKIADRIFDEFRDKRFRPFNEIDQDPLRHELDRCVLVDLLSLNSDLLKPDGPMQKLRRKLSQEPSIRGTKS